MKKKDYRYFKAKMKQVLKVLLAIFLVVCIILGTYVFGVFSGFIDTTKDLGLDGTNMNFTTFVYYEDDETGKMKIYENLHGNENRVWTDLADVPSYVRNAAVAIEDERFYQHNGFDLKSTVYATFSYVVFRSTNRGASTITQQLVKNLTGENEKNAFRKVKEIFTSVGLEKKMSKDQILEMYLNTIFLGNGCNGIGSAANFYFDKEVNELDLAEGAALVGITQYPSRYDPLVNPENNKEKQELVLYKMLQLHYITQDQYNKAIAEKLVFCPNKDNEKEQKSLSQSYFTDEVVKDVLADLQAKYGYTEEDASNLLYTGGLSIYSTVDPVVQNTMEKFYEKDSNFLKAPISEQPQSSMTIIDPNTGYIKGIIGGRGEKTADRTLNRASQSLRQPGSTIKPIAVYGPAFDKSLITPSSVYEDKQLTYNDWKPKNYYSGFRGNMSVKYAIEQSVNTVPVQILEEMGVNTSYNYLTNKLGVSSLVNSDKNLSSLALGGLTKGITNRELTAAYAAFANDGVYIEPVTYTKVIDHSGKVILEKNQKHSNAFLRTTAETMNAMLRCVVLNGTGVASNFSYDYDICGKTGTTDDDKDRWFVGYTPYYVGSVWVGYDTPRSLSFFGSNPTIPVWKSIMQTIHKEKKLPSKYFEGTQKYDYKATSENKDTTKEDKETSESQGSATENKNGQNSQSQTKPNSETKPNTSTQHNDPNIYSNNGL